MKKLLSLSFLLCFGLSINAQDIYEDALTSASYAYSHSKKAHTANNVFHTQEYADKALEAYQKVESLSQLCGCTTANETVYETIDDLQSALDEDTYERSRFYVKRVKENGSKILEMLTECQANSATVIASNEEEQNTASEEIKTQQLALEEKQKALELQQRQLNQQIALQEKRQKEFEAKRAKELEEQRAIKSKAELALQNLENALLEFNVVFNSDDVKLQLQNDYLRSKNELENESLDETKNFYVNRAKELTKSALKQFANYDEDE